MVWAERLVEVFVDPAEPAFFATMLEGITELARQHGLRRLEAEVDPTDHSDFEHTGWRGVGRSARSRIWSLSLPT